MYASGARRVRLACSFISVSRHAPLCTWPVGLIFPGLFASRTAGVITAETVSQLTCTDEKKWEPGHLAIVTAGGKLMHSHSAGAFDKQSFNGLKFTGSPCRPWSLAKPSSTSRLFLLACSYSITVVENENRKQTQKKTTRLAWLFSLGALHYVFEIFCCIASSTIQTANMASEWKGDAWGGF